MDGDVQLLGKVRTLVFRERANKDPLTQLYNRWYFARYIERIRDDFLITGQPFAIFLIDIDHFKRINDSYGYSTGDEVLKSVAGLLKETAREKGFFVARFGGEEFVGIGTYSKEEMRNICEELKERVKGSLEPKFGFPVTISAGVASVNEEVNLANLIGLADKRLYKAKQTGRNRVVDS